jgi:dTDP-4-amino-4,6-dideoxygalactose transaminase/acetyltransferase-like isoleucine patch superfamily enzyme
MSAPYVHPSAVVDAGVALGEGVRVWHFAHVSAGARIGVGTVLGQNAFVGKGVQLGARVRVQNNVSIYEGVEIGDDVFLGPSCVFTNVKNPRAHVSRKAAYQVTRVARGASIGANATVVCGVSVGAYALVAAGATVTRDVPDFGLVTGLPARLSGWVCRCGETLTHDARPAAPVLACRACGAQFRPGQGMIEEISEASVQAPRPVSMLDPEAQNAPLAAALRAAFDRVLASGQFILGPEVSGLEEALCRELRVGHAICVSSGTDALLLSLMALGIEAGDEVITAAFSFFASAGCIARLGARPVFVDIDPVTFNLDVAKLEAARTSRTKAVIAVHLFGQAAELGPLAGFCRQHGIALIEDAAQAIGATYQGTPVGTLGAFGCFSFFPSKNLGGFGDGGVVVTQDDALAQRARTLRVHGAEPKYFHPLLGGNFRLDALQAALLAVKLPRLPQYTEARRRHARAYDAAFLPLVERAQLQLPLRVQEGHVYNQYVIRSDVRDGLMNALRAQAIASEVYYPKGLHLQPCFASLGYREGDFPETERASRQVLALPVHAELLDADLARVVQAVRRFFAA